MDHTQALAVKLREQRIADGLKVRPGVSDAELAAFEAREGIRLPEELRVYLGVVNGMADWETDAELVEFLSLDRMAEELAPAPDEQSHWLIVAQYCFHARVYALRVTNEPAVVSPVYPLGEPSQAPLFGSFTELLEVYLSDPEGLVVR